jgi:hypothetical protein
MDERKPKQSATLPVTRAEFSTSLHTTKAFAEPITDSVTITISYTYPNSCSPNTQTDAYALSSAYSNPSTYLNPYTDTYTCTYTDAYTYQTRAGSQWSRTQTTVYLQIAAQPPLKQK